MNRRPATCRRRSAAGSSPCWLWEGRRQLARQWSAGSVLSSEGCANPHGRPLGSAEGAPAPGGPASLARRRSVHSRPPYGEGAASRVPPRARPRRRRARPHPSSRRSRPRHPAIAIGRRRPFGPPLHPGGLEGPGRRLAPQDRAFGRRRATIPRRGREPTPVPGGGSSMRPAPRPEPRTRLLPRLLRGPTLARPCRRRPPTGTRLVRDRDAT